MPHHFELSCSIPLPNIITNFLLNCGPIHGALFCNRVWDLILFVNLCEAPLSTTPVQGFIPLLTLLINPHQGPKLENQEVLIHLNLHPHQPERRPNLPDLSSPGLTVRDSLPLPLPLIRESP